MTTCPPIVGAPEITPEASRMFGWFTAAAVGTWIVCGVWPFERIMAGAVPSGAALIYGVIFVVYGAAMLGIQTMPMRRKRPRQATAVTLVAIEAAAGIAHNAFTLHYLHGTGAGIGLVVIVAGQLPFFVTVHILWIWIATQTVVLSALLLANPEDALTLGVAFGAFQAFAAASSYFAINEGRAHDNLARANAELQATRSLLAESSRAEERLRIARDLHDTLGHHLTALSLQLDVASRLAEGRAAEHLHQAHAVAKLLLSDVRDVVSRTREASPIDVASTVTAMAERTLGVTVHVNMPADFRVDDAEQADALVKSVREIITNTVRHAGAKTLTLDVRREGVDIIVNACDDGSGAADVWWGNGLTGMRERFEQFGGVVEVRTGAGRGFEIRGAMPVRSAP